MKRLLQIFFSVLLAISSFLQYAKTGEKTPMFTDQPPHEKSVVKTPAFQMGAFDLVVSPDGSNAAAGTPDSPLRTIEKAKEKLPLTPAYLRVLVLGNLQLPCKNASLCILKKQKPFFPG